MPEAALPKSLVHRITVDGQVLDIAPIAVSKRPPIVIGAPLRGGNWRALNGPGPGSGHWATVIASGGTERFPDRFAIDWVRVGEDGKTHAGDTSRNENYYAYGQPVIAVADGTVMAVTDGIIQNVPGSRAVAVTSETVCGNSISLSLGLGRFAFYCHMQPGSLRVQLGQHLRKGQVIGLVGNSGDGSESHLHFQVSDGKSLVASEGIPYLLESFYLFDANQRAKLRRRELPLRDEHVRFAE